MTLSQLDKGGREDKEMVSLVYINRIKNGEIVERVVICEGSLLKNLIEVTRGCKN